MKRKGYIYILRDSKGKFYIGSICDIERRIYQHKIRHTSTTKRMNLPRIVLIQEFPSLDAARKVEIKIKKLKRKDYIQKMISDGNIKIR